MTIHVGWLVSAAAGFVLVACFSEDSSYPATGFLLGMVAMLGLMAARGV